MTWWTLAIPCSNSPLHSGGKQHSPGACLTAALHSQLVGSPYLCGVDLLYDLKDSFMFWDFLPHVSSIVMPSPFYSPNEQLQSKGGGRGTVLYVSRGMREWWRASGVRRENQADGRACPSFPWAKRQAVAAQSGGWAAPWSRRETAQESPYAFVLLLSVPVS